MQLQTPLLADLEGMQFLHRCLAPIPDRCPPDGRVRPSPHTCLTSGPACTRSRPACSYGTYDLQFGL